MALRSPFRTPFARPSISCLEPENNLWKCPTPHDRIFENKMILFLMEYLYGVQPVLAALQSNRRKIFQLLLYETSKTMPFDKPYCMNVALQVQPLRIPKVAEPDGQFGTPSIMLADITDPQNVGSILRTAFYFGIERVFLTKGCSSLTPVVSKASSGSLESFAGRIAYCHSKGSGFLDAANRLGWRTIATGVSGLPSYDDEREATSRDDVCNLLVLGNEGIGIPKGIVDRCKYSMNIQGSKMALELGVDSLNVSTAAGILISRLIHTYQTRRTN